MSRFEAGELNSFFKNYDPENPRHVDAVNLLQEEVEALDADAMSDYASWVRLYRSRVGLNVGLKFTPFCLRSSRGSQLKNLTKSFATTARISLRRLASAIISKLLGC